MEDGDLAIQALVQRLREWWAYSPWALLTPEDRAANREALLLLAADDLETVYRDVVSTLEPRIVVDSEATRTAPPAEPNLQKWWESVGGELSITSPAGLKAFLNQPFRPFGR